MSAMSSPVATPVEVRESDLDRVKYNADGLVAAIVQDVETRAVLMMAWMNAETLRMSLEQGRTVFWSRSRDEVWRKGDTSGDRQFIRSAHVDCDGDTLLFLVEQEGAGRLPHRVVHLLLPGLRVRRGDDGASRADLSMAFPDRETFRKLARTHRVVPVWHTMLADLTTPLAAFSRLCGDDESGRSGFLLESVDHGGRWGRWSFIGRDPKVKLVARAGQVEVSGALPADVPTDEGCSQRSTPCWRTTGRRARSRLRRRRAPRSRRCTPA